MNIRTKNILILVACFMLTAVVVVVLVVVPNRKDMECAAVNVSVSDYDDYQFITRLDVETMLKKYGDNPGGKILSDVDMNEIEREIEKHPMVRRAVCYQSPNGDLNIDVTQRIPVFRVMSAAGDYYVDNERSKMPVTVKSSAYVTVVSGNVNLDFALGELYDFVVYLQSDNFFNSLVEQIYIYPNNRMELIPRVGDFVIVFGTTERYEAKLKKMKVFYETVPQRMGWNSYSKINLEYKDQVVCTRR